MASLQDELALFKDCTGSYPYDHFLWLLSQLGYEERKAGKTGGARRKFYNQATGHLIMLHAPHGRDMGRGMVRRMQKALEEIGVI